MAQQKMTINLTKSDKAVGGKLNGADIVRVYNGTFVQKFSTLRADSAIIYPASNTFDAFGHVVITQGDTLHVYSDKLNYNDNTKIALLTDHVRLVDKDATLTTNILNYNTATKYGTYTEGGKLVNKDNTLISKNGYYFAQSRDAYFRYDVVMTSPDALIKTDTLRYNSGTRITYFYGPTHIYGKKDKDTLYTENGTYNTKTEQAFFGKKNRYSQGTKSLKGDSLFYDKLKGYGKAIKNITFMDTEQKMILKGNLGEYFKKDDKAVVTQNPYVIFVTEERDTSKTDSSKLAPPPQKTDELTSAVKTATAMAKDARLNKPPGIPKNIPQGKSDSLAKAIAANPEAKKALDNAKDLKLTDIPPDVVKNLTPGKADSLAKAIAAMPAVKNAMPMVNSKMQDSIKKMAAKIAANQPKNTKAITPAKSAKGKAALADTTKKVVATDTIRRIKRDTMYIGADTLETQIVTYKFLKDLQEQRRLAGIRDTGTVLRKPFVPYTKATIPKFLSADMPQPIFEPYTYKNRPLFTRVKAAPDTTKKPAIKPDDKAPASKDAALAKGKKPDNKPDAKSPAVLKSADKKALADTLAKHKADSILNALKPKLSDTSRVRILSAHHNVHIFKSDLQGKSDSLFYSNADSVIRSFVKPMYWTQGSQLSGDTIYLQLKNKKADYMDVFQSGFVVNIEKADSLHFNQMGGKRIQAWFKDSKLSKLLTTGNAETIYWNRKKDKVTEMQHSISSTITMNMKNGQMANMQLVTKTEQKADDIKKVKEDDKLLKAFIWKPKERPKSKEDVIHPKKPEVEKETPKKGEKGKNTEKPDDKEKTVKTDDKKLVTSKDSVATKTPAPTLKPIKKDSISAAKTDTLKKPVDLKIKKDTVAKKP
jgi:lipopolysaccharide export system protein LptA